MFSALLTDIVVGALGLISNNSTLNVCAPGIEGVDLHTLWDKHGFANTPDECCANCTALPNCNAWSWEAFNSDPHRGNCWYTLNPYGPRPTKVKGVVSGRIAGRPSPPAPPPMPPNGPCGQIPLPTKPPPVPTSFKSFQRNVRDPSHPPNCSHALPWQDVSGNYIDAHGAGILLDPVSRKCVKTLLYDYTCKVALTITSFWKNLPQ